jgi:hypothetical protein
MAVWVLVFLLAATAGWLGVAARNWTFVATADVRMWWDINNGFERGKAVVNEARRAAGLQTSSQPAWWQLWRSDREAPRESHLNWGQFASGFLRFYDKVAAQVRWRNIEPRYNLDYAPLRLLIMSAWTKHVLERDPQAAYRDDLAWPLMHFNAVVAVLGAGAMFFVVYAWRQRCALHLHQQPGRRLAVLRGEHSLGEFDRAGLIALAAAAIFFLNPAIILNSHGFVQWDTWIVPFVLLAMGFGAMDRWGWAGLALGASMGFKGQVLLVLPAFVLWPVFAAQFLGALRFAIGFVFAWIAVGLPWLIPNSTAWLWLGTTILLGVSFATTGYPRRFGLTWWLGAGVATALVIGPYLNENAVWWIWAPLSLVAAMILLPWILPRGNAALIVGVLALGAIVAAAHRFGGSWNWFYISYIFPSYQYKTMYMGPTSNLPALLAEFGWGIDHTLWTAAIGSWKVELQMRHALVALNMLLCAVCALAAGIQHRRRDPAMLISLATPWVIAFALLPQMHERYLTWAAAICGVGVACSIGLGLLHWLIIALSFLMTFTQMLNMHSGDWPTLLPILRQLHPQVAWALLLAACVYLYASFVRSRLA